MVTIIGQPFGYSAGGGEIDVFEFYGDEEKPELTCMRYYNPNDPDDRVKCTYLTSGPDYSSSFHTYTLIWDKYYISWYIDGDLKATHWKFESMLGQGLPCTSIHPWLELLFSKSFPPIDSYQHIVFNVAGDESNNPNPVPRNMEVQYIRVWQRQDYNCEDITISSLPSPTIKARSINVIGNVNIPSGESHSLIAQTRIKLTSQLKVSSGGCLTLKAIPHLCENCEESMDGFPTPQLKTGLNEDSISELQGTCTQTNSDGISLFPNPVIDNLHVISDKMGKIEILSISGKMLYSDFLTESEATINISSFAKGFYVFRIICDDGVFIKKIYKK